MFALALLLAPAQAALILESTSPPNGATHAPAHGPFTLTFNQPVRLSSFVQSLPHLPGFQDPTIRLSPATGAGGLPVKWTITRSENRRTVSLVPSVPLAEGVFYQLYVSRKGDVYPVKQDTTFNTQLEADEGAPNPFIFSVTDDVAPEVRGFVPGDGAGDLPVNPRIQVLVSEPLDPDTVRLTLNGAPVPVRRDDTGFFWTAAPSLQPSTTYSAAFTGADHGGNPLPALSWSFATGPSAEPDTQPPAIAAANPVPGSTRVPPTVQPAVTFSEPVSPLSLRVSMGICESDAFVEELDWELSPDGRTLTLRPPALVAGPTCYAVPITATDRAGNPLPPFGTPGNRLSFTTADLTGPALLNVTPAPETAVDPVTGPDLAFRFSEDVRTGGTDAPVLKLEYASGEPPPVLDPRDAVPLGGGRWRLEGEGWATPRDLTLRVLPGAGTEDRYSRGDRLFLHLESAADLAGNTLRAGPVSTHWSLTVTGFRPSHLLEIAPAEGAMAALDAPVVVRFSLPMNPSRLLFEADGDWSPTATEMFDGASRYSPRRWASNSTAWNEDRRVATLRHLPFEESHTDAPVPHAFRILAAPDAGGQPYLLGEGQSPVRSWTTGRRPRIESVEYLAPVDPESDLTPAGLLADPADPARSAWQPHSEGVELPLNTRLRIRFTHPMDPVTLGPPSVSFEGPVPALAVESERLARLAFNVPLSPLELRHARSPDDALVPLPSPLVLTFTDGSSALGDRMAPYTLPLRPLDTRPPAFRVEYRANAGEASQPPEWRPLSGATVPPDAPWRIVADETLALAQAVSVEREGDFGPDPLAAGPRFSERADADDRAGNAQEIRWERPLATTGMARPGAGTVEMQVRVRVRDLRTLPGPNVAEQTVSFRVAVPRRPLPGDIDGNGLFDARDVDRALDAYLSKTPLTPEELLAVDLIPSGGDGAFDATDVNALFRLFLHQR